jgi:Deacetylase PdaC/Protein of unknown function (DUF3298)
MNSPLAVLTFAFPGSIQLPDRFSVVLVGKIDNKFPIQMELNRNQDELYGRYFYENKREGNYLSLRGKIDTTDMVTISEYGRDKETGSFTGKLFKEVLNGNSRLKFTGNWTSAKDAKALPFELVERPVDLGGGLKITTRKQDEKIQAQKFSIDIAYPQLTGGSGARVENFNQAMSDFVAQEARNFKAQNKKTLQAESGKGSENTPENALDIRYNVVHADKDLISVLYTVYVYTGGAHGNAASRAFNYDLSRGEMLELSDLFEPNSNYIKLIADYSINALKKRRISDDSWIESGAGAKSQNYASWNIVPQGLMITFDAYQVAAYALGSQEVIVPFSVLKGAVKRDGPLAAFVK